MFSEIQHQSDAQGKPNGNSSNLPRAEELFELLDYLCFDHRDTKLYFGLAVGPLPACGTFATNEFIRTDLTILAPSAIRTVGCSVLKAIAAIAKDRGNVRAILFGIRCRHDASLHVALASIKDVSVVRRPFLDAGAPVEANVVVSVAGDEFDFALQPRVTFGTGTVHSIVVQFFFERKIGHDRIYPRVGTEFPMAVSANPLVVTKQIARPVVCRGIADDKQNQ